MTSTTCAPVIELRSSFDEICMRELEPGETEVIAELLRRSSDETIMRRFHQGGSRITGAMVRHLADVGDHRGAIVAFDAAGPVALGEIAHYRRDPTVAEIAVLVVDDAQGRGLGKALVEAVTRMARDRGVRSIEFDVEPWNRPALALFKHAPSRFEDGSVVGTIDLLAPSAPGRSAA